MMNISSIRILSQNVRSLNRNFDKLVTFLEDEKTTPYQIVALQEIWQIMGNYAAPGFQSLIYKDRKDRRGGGVGFFISSDIKIERLNNCDVFIEGVYESMAIKIPKLKIGLINIYRPPDGSLDEFHTQLRTQVHNITELGLKPIVLGDINVNASKDDRNWRNLVTLLADLGLSNKVREISRYTGTRGTLLDHVYTGAIQHVTCTVVSTEITDHEGIEVQVGMAEGNSKAARGIKKIEIFSYKEANVKKVRTDLNGINWRERFKDKNVHEASEYLENELSKSLINNCQKEITIGKTKDWQSNSLQRLRIKLLKSKDYFKNNKNDNSLNKYKALKKRYNDQYNMERKNYLNAKLREEDPKKLWQNINEITLRKHKLDRQAAPISEIEFLDHFKNIATKIEDGLPEPAVDPLQYSKQSELKFDFDHINATDLIKIMKSIKPKKSYGKDKISNKAISLLKTSILEPMQLIMNKIFDSGIFPKNWKIARVIPLHKGGDETEKNNYRPISLLPTLSKIAEKCMAQQMYSFFESNNLFPDTQYGFRKGRGTGQALVNMTYEVEHLRKKQKNYAIILVDFSKAFDVINHTLLYRKLKLFGFTAKSIALIRSYLSDRRMYVENGKSISQITRCKNVGCPQGSVLGPLIYLIYTIDIKDLLKNEIKLMFADDTGIVVELPPKNDDALATLRMLITKIYNHFTANKLKMNVSKTIIMAPNAKGDINFGNEKITIKDVKETSKYLGLQISAKLHWEKQVNSVENRLKKGIFALSRVSNIANTETKLMIYNALFKSHLTYGLHSWGFSLTSRQKKRLEVLQKIAIRKVAGKRKFSHTSPLFKKLGELKLEDLMEQVVLSEGLDESTPLARFFRVVASSTRNINIQTNRNGPTIAKHCNILKQNWALRSLGLSKKTMIKHFRTKKLQGYSVNCEKPNCYICQTDT